MESGRDPCPWRILDDVGGAFAMGAVGGSVWHGVKGFRNSPRGQALVGSVASVRARAPVLGGNFAVWGGLFASFDCTLAYLRQKEDSWNSIMSGAATGGVLAMRAGPKAAGRNALVGGVLLAVIEGFGIMINKAFAPGVPSAEEMAKMDPNSPETLAPPVPFMSGSISDMLGGGGGGFSGQGESGTADNPQSSDAGFDTDMYSNAPKDSLLDDPYASGKAAAEPEAASPGLLGRVAGFFGSS